MLRLFSTKSNFLTCVGVTLFIAGFLIVLSHQIIFNGVLKKVLSLRPNSQGFEFWKESIVPIGFNIYFFNWTNPDEIRDPTKKPNLVELGPYSFRLNVEKINATFHENSTLSYLTKKTWFFDEAKSNGSLHDSIIQLNTVAVTAGHKIRYWDDILQEITSDQLDDLSSKISIKKTVNELLFVGFEDSFMEMSRQYGFDDNPAPFDKFGWFYMRNGSTEFDGYSNIGTGEDNLDELGLIKQWNYKDRTDFYRSPRNFLEGGAGDYIFPPNRTKESIKFFNNDLCQTISNEFVGQVNHKGIEGYKFVLDQKTLGNDTELCDARAPTEKSTEEVYSFDEATIDYDPSMFDDSFNSWWGSQAEYEDFLNHTAGKKDNSGLSETVDNDEFSSDASKSNKDLYVDDLSKDQVSNTSEDNNPCHCNGECSPVGLINVTACRYGIPLFMSLPHFYHGDPQLTEAVNGLNPREEDHSFYFIVEPTTGISLDVAIRLQINVMLQSSKKVRMLKQMPEKMFFPMFWFEAKAGIPDNMVLPVQVLKHMPTILKILGIFMMFVGSLAFIISTFCYKVNRKLQLQQNLKNEITNSPSKIFVIEENF